MGMAEYRRSGCVGKRAYRTWVDAETVAKRVNRRSDTEGIVMVYRCKFCGQYHLGQNTERFIFRKRRWTPETNDYDTRYE